MLLATISSNRSLDGHNRPNTPNNTPFKLTRLMTPSLTLHIHCTHVYEATAGCKVAIDYDTSRRGVRGFVASMGNNAGHDLLNWDVWPFLVGSDHPSPRSMVVWCTKKRRKWHDRLNLQRPPHQTQSHSSRNL